MTQVYIDAATRQDPLQSACGIIFRHDSDIVKYGEYLGDIDNHHAEWQSLIIAMKLSLQNNYTSLLIKTDSKIVADSIHKKFVRKAAYKIYLQEYLALEPQFELVIIDWIPRTENKHADTIARRTLNRYS
ncbi:ribonuclease H [Macrococcoides caseolyticum subsp. caseolyticum]|uniref:ribonuclease HI family protein n=1 Tax=Macrococcoides caseolyticum TaxID=69966 RepID=UPI000CD040BE|nr:ribonuclease HI family protein [Macrococcus caseolyticus]PNZ72595.1 ribonuclease H [Macrococcus caseolyticus]QPT47169.1 ribonuclease HI family protein [Macrococcus caseolyticus]RAK48287.1 ribonuclease H [Macrococcus caseolyticus subsp. caseolyticus]HCD18212.1 ribonuclease H [Macrococcus caseolyticus]